jgi:hypothetical protein
MMGICIFCGKPAGFFRDKHQECARELQSAKNKITSIALEAIKGDSSMSALGEKIAEIEKTNKSLIDSKKQHLILAWEKAVDDFLEDGIIDAGEEKRLVEFKDYFCISQSDLDGSGAFEKVAKSAVLRDVLAGKIPKQVRISGTMPINLQKDESVAWIFSNSKYLEDKIKRQFVGRSQGVSLRIMKGVYYRIGDFRGQSVESEERTHIDTGIFVLTNKNVYFAGPRKSVRIPYSKIVSFEPYGDGIGIMRDAASAKPQIFVTHDGWFTYNLAVNLARL